MSKVAINVHQVTRVEGHGNIILNARDGKIEELRWEVPESPRLFEAMVKGRRWDEIQHIVSRICGICSIGHTLASLKATEDAFGIQPSEQTVLLRKLLLNAENLQSHVLHAYFLAAPDFLGVGSVIPLAKSHPEVVLCALRLKRLANDVCDWIGGRTTHPVAALVGGFGKLPRASELKEFKKKCEEGLKDLDFTAKVFSTLNIPDFTRETEYISLTDATEYALLNGVIKSSDAGTYPAGDYLKVTNEYCVPHSTAKFSRNKRDAYAVGALARFNNNAGQLLPRAREVAGALGLKAPCYNPFMNTVAQVVEAVESVQQCINLMDTLLSRGIKEGPILVEACQGKVKAGRGIGAVEVPRGILFHDYTYDKDGLITDCNCIIPTNQNHANIQKDFEALVPKVLDRPQDEIRLMLEMLVRSYDPCISCSAHLLKVKFV